MTFRFSTLLTILLTAAGLAAQEKDATLFTVAGHSVPVSEFVYIYEKTNGKNADYSRKSLEEYLDLYVRFKLKVQRARDMKLDTIPTLKSELEGYRRQLSDSYLIDREVTEKLTREAYERARQDVDISHILIAVAPNATPADTLEAFEKAKGVKQRLLNGDDFARVAREASDDKSAKGNGGHIGFVTALFPNGFYALETAAYALPVGKISDPVRTGSGYHILKVEARRPARGEVEAAHIMLRTKDKDPAQVKVRIDSIYQALQNGAGFEELARRLSEDGFTAEKNGYIGFFGINLYEKAFEDAAFGLQKDGDYSAPFQTNVGWHIMRRISRREIQPYDVERRRYEERVKKDDRHEAARVAMVERIKKDNHFTDNPKMLQQFADTLTKDFLTFRWKGPQKKSTAELFRLGRDIKVTLGDFTDYLAGASRQRMALAESKEPAAAAHELYSDFVNDYCMKFQEAHLEEKYPDFRYLMREYEEGILLFEATQIEVWNKASIDSSGLAAFFGKIKDKYMWEERASTSNYRLAATAREKLNEVREYAQTHTPEEVLARFNTEDNLILSVEERMIEKSKNAALIGTPWHVGALSPVKEAAPNQPSTFFKIENILKATNKTLDEARGYVIAEYQDYLEQKWVEQLRKDYKVSVNNKTFDSLVKK